VSPPSQIRAEHKFRMPENKIMKIYKLKIEEVTGGWTKLCDKEEHKLYFSPILFV
jgi:hypothetical protein